MTKMMRRMRDQQQLAARGYALRMRREAEAREAANRMRMTGIPQPEPYRPSRPDRRGIWVFIAVIVAIDILLALAYLALRLDLITL